MTKVATVQLPRPTARTRVETDLVFNIAVSDCRFAAVANRDYTVLDQVLKDWRKNNLELKLTGALLLCDGSFVHLLEGTARQVARMRQRVMADPLHSNVRSLHEQHLAVRRFSAWPLAYVGPSRWVSRALKGHPISEMDAGSADEAAFLVDLILSFVGDDPGSATELSLPAWV